MVVGARVKPRWSLGRVLRWLGTAVLVFLLGVPALFYVAFLGIQEASERQWLGQAPQHAAINVRSTQAHAVGLIDVGFDSLAARLRLIEAARESIELEFFIYELDEASRLISQALARKAAQGVKVRILVDFAAPVFKLAPQVASTLKAAGVQVRYYNTSGLARIFAMQHRTHRKLLVADRRVAIIGGRNIGNEYFDLSTHYNFLDSDLLIEGEVASAIADSFELYWGSDWVTHPQDTPPDPNGPQLLGPPSALETQLAAELGRHKTQYSITTCHDMHFITDYPGSGVERRRVYTAIEGLVKEAQHRIVVESPYLVLRDDGIGMLQSVLERGVKLQILTNTLHSTDAFYTVSSLADSLDRLKLPNLEIWGYKGKPLQQGDRATPTTRWGVHAKRAVFDDHTVLVGTYNLDPRSANLNAELIVICRHNPALAASMTQSLQARLGQSRAITGTPEAGGLAALLEGADAQSVWQMRMATPFVRLFDFLL